MPTLRSWRWTVVVLGCIAGLAGPLIGGEAGESAAPPAAYVYQGRQVATAWVDQQYAYFKDKIARVDGKYYDIGKGLAQIALARQYPLEGPPCAVTATPPAPGEARLSCFRPTSLRADGPPATGAAVLQVVGPREVIVTSGRVLFHVRGTDPNKHIDGVRFWEVLMVYAGTYRYVDSAGAARTIQSFVVYEPITREQFVEALAGGFELVRYRMVTRKVPGGGELAGGGGFSPPIVTKKTLVERREVVRQPVVAPAGAPTADAPRQGPPAPPVTP